MKIDEISPDFVHEQSAILNRPTLDSLLDIEN